jgi:hypothetical protein
VSSGGGGSGGSVGGGGGGGGMASAATATAAGGLHPISVDMTGMVMKKGQKVKNWKKRYSVHILSLISFDSVSVLHFLLRFLVLQGNDLKYFESSESWQLTLPKGYPSSLSLSLSLSFFLSFLFGVL